MKTVKIIIDKNGKTSLEASGFKGVSCSEVTSKFSSILGKITVDNKKDEYYESDENLLKE